MVEVWRGHRRRVRIWGPLCLAFGKALAALFLILKRWNMLFLRSLSSSKFSCNSL